MMVESWKSKRALPGQLMVQIEVLTMQMAGATGADKAWHFPRKCKDPRHGRQPQVPTAPSSSMYMQSSRIFGTFAFSDNYQNIYMLLNLNRFILIDDRK